MKKKAILLGASGLIGGDLLDKLLNSEEYLQVLVVVRKALNNQHPKLKQLIVDFDQLQKYANEIVGDVVFCCLGTTKNKTPDKTQYRKIDCQYPVDVAWMAYTNGATAYHFVSSMGADPESRIFYSSVKGEAESALKTIPFKSLHLYRPSLLVGNRKEKRTGEELMIKIMHLINPLLIGPLKKYRSIKTETVATAMYNQSLAELHGIFVYLSDEINKTGTVIPKK